MGRRPAQRDPGAIAVSAPQLKPNGWAGEAAWAGEFPLAAHHTRRRRCAAAGDRITSGPGRAAASSIDGTVTVDYANNPGTYLSELWWVRRTTAPATNSNLWNSATFVNRTAGHLQHPSVPDQNPATTSRYWLLAETPPASTAPPSRCRSEAGRHMNNNKIKNGDAMSGNEPTGARRRRKTKVAVWLGVAGMCATGASLVPIGGHTQAAPAIR